MSLCLLLKWAILNYWIALFFQEAAGEGIPILLLGNKMDMDGDREVSFKEAEQLAYVSLIQSSWIVLFYALALKILILLRSRHKDAIGESSDHDHQRVFLATFTLLSFGLKTNIFCYIYTALAFQSP